MKRIKRTIYALCLLVLFVGYQASVTAFTHVHYVNGVLITHSHPFHNQHSHSATSLIAIGLLSHFSSDKPDCSEIQHPMRSLLRVVENETDTSVFKGKAYRMISLRAPPYSVTLRYCLYQRPVFAVPTLGIRCTDVWYLSYQCLVFAVPTPGICRTYG